MAYKRLISYFDLIEDKEKRGNAGFVKWEQYDECHILSVFVSGMGASFHKEAKVYLDESVLGTLSIRGGRGEGTYLLTGEDKERKEYIEAIKIALDDKRVLVAEFEAQEKRQKHEKNVEQEKPVRTVDETAQEEEMPAEEDNMPEKAEAQVEEESEPDNGTEEVVPKGVWEQLLETHESFFPFNNEVECFRIFPKDLNLLQTEYRLFQSNQFLMHGYYNYRHLILFRKKDDLSEYWLGVPGIYHEREKMAARMFGFEKFESANRDYKTGDLGYYLVTVK